MATKGKGSIIRGAALVVGLLLGAGLGTSGMVAAQAIPPEVPTLQLSPNVGPVGAAAVASGSLYGVPIPPAIWSERVSLFFDRSLVANGATDEHGVFALAFSVPDVAAGRHQVTAVGRTSRRTVWGVFTIYPGTGLEIPPVTQLQVILPAGPPGSSVEVRGYVACSNVDLLWLQAGAAPTYLGSATAHDGRLDTHAVIPQKAKLSQGTIQARGQNPNMCSGEGTFRVCYCTTEAPVAGPSITVLPRKGPGGTLIHIKGKWFTQQSVSHDICPTEIVFTDANGAWTLIRSLPYRIGTTFKTTARIPADAAIGAGTVIAYNEVFLGSCFKLTAGEDGFAVTA